MAGFAVFCNAITNAGVMALVMPQTKNQELKKEKTHFVRFLEKKNEMALHVFEVGSRSWPKKHSLGTLTDVRDGCGKLCGFDYRTLSGPVFVFRLFSGPYVRVFRRIYIKE